MSVIVWLFCVVIMMSLFVVIVSLIRFCMCSCLLRNSIVNISVKNVCDCNMSDVRLVGMLMYMLVNRNMNWLSWIVVLYSISNCYEICGWCMKNIVGMVVSVKCSVLSSIGGMLCRLILIMMKFMFYVRIMISVSSKFFGVIIGVFFDC